MVNKLDYIIKTPKIRFSSKQLGQFDYHVLLKNDVPVFNEKDLELIQVYSKLVRSVSMRINNSDDDKDNYNYLFQDIRKQLLDIIPDEDHAVDVLVTHLFGNGRSKRKRVFWGCFGNVVLRNIENNIDKNTVMCSGCGKRFVPSNNRHIYCPKCSITVKKEKTKERVRRYRIRAKEK